jgi:hypothetical protein
MKKNLLEFVLGHTCPICGAPPDVRCRKLGLPGRLHDQRVKIGLWDMEHPLVEPEIQYRVRTD